MRTTNRLETDAACGVAAQPGKHWALRLSSDIELNRRKSHDSGD